MQLVISTPVIENTGNGLVVTSETIAQGAGVEHRAVLQMITKHQARVERFGPLAFEMRQGSALPQGGFAASTRVALLNEQQSTLIMSFMRNTEQVMDFKEALVDGFFKMAEKLNNAPPLTNEQIVAQALQITSDQVKELSSKLALVQPKADYVDTFVADNDYSLFRTIASDLNVGEGELRWALVYTGWIYHDSQKRRNSKGEIVTEHLWSEYADKKQYFFRALNHQAPLFKGNVKYTLKLTTPGVAAVGRHIQKIIAEYGSLRTAVPILEARYNDKKAA